MRKEHKRATRQVLGARQHSSVTRLLCCDQQAFGRSSGKQSRGLVERVQFYAVAVCLLEVVTDDFVGTIVVAINLLRSQLVKLRTDGLWQRRIGHIAHEGVVEAQGSSRVAGMDQAFCDQTRERRFRVCVSEHVKDSGTIEVASEYRCCLQEGALVVM